MTCVVAYEHEGSVYLGGDSYLCNDAQGEFYNLCSESKVYRVGNIGVGVCGNVSCEQALEELLRKLVKSDQVVDLKFVKSELIPKFRRILKRRGLLTEGENGLEMIGKSCFILAFGGKAYFLEEDLSIWNAQVPYNSVGAGEKPAKSAFEAMELLEKDLKIKITPEKKVEIALKTAANLHHQVSGPFTYVKV
jgi:hypothetical protein